MTQQGRSHKAMCHRRQKTVIVNLAKKKNHLCYRQAMEESRHLEEHSSSAQTAHSGDGAISDGGPRRDGKIQFQFSFAKPFRRNECNQIPRPSDQSHSLVQDMHIEMECDLSTQKRKSVVVFFFFAQKN